MIRSETAGARTGRRGWYVAASVLLFSVGVAVESAQAAEGLRTVQVLPHGVVTIAVTPLAPSTPVQPPLSVATMPPLPPGWSAAAAAKPDPTPGYAITLTAGDEETVFGPDPVAWRGRMRVLDGHGVVLAAVNVLAMPGARVSPTGARAVTRSPVWWILLGNVVVWAIVIPAGYYVFLYRPAQWKRTLPHGRLVPMDNRSRRVTKPVDLRHVAYERRKMRLLLGTDRTADVLLRHDDVEPRHAWIATVPDPTRGPHLQLTPVDGARVGHNGTLLTGPVALEDGDRISLGMVKFTFEMAELYRPIIVECRDGRRLEGFPAQWDTTAPGFVLRPRDAAADEQPTIVPYESIRAVHFVTDWDLELRKRLVGKPEYPAGERVCLRFADGQEWQGHLTANYSPEEPRFHFLPEPAEGVLVSLIERSALDALVPLDA